MFIDEVTIKLQAGKGGDGVATFRREKYIPKGGPDGGDGGNGGNIIFVTDGNIDTLSDYNARKQFKADDGEKGKNKKMHGKNGQDLLLKIPPGTIIYEIINNKKQIVIDMNKNSQEYIICRGGKGGLGNVHFKSSTHQTPKEFTYGSFGQKKTIILEMQLIADVGLIGLPNAGKSTLISAITKAKPKIASYPFTTIIPNLGLAIYKNKKILFADIPGLIEGASNGKGLGVQFLKHIKRTKILAHLINITQKNPYSKFQEINNELKKFDVALSDKKQLIVFNKIDLINPKDQTTIFKNTKKLFKNKKTVFISAAGHINLNEFLTKIISLL